MTETENPRTVTVLGSWEITPQPTRIRIWEQCAKHGWHEHTANGECVRCIADELQLDREYHCELCGKWECSH